MPSRFSPENQPTPETTSFSISLERYLEQDLPQAYRTDIKLLRETGLLELLPQSETMGLLGIDGKEYPVPTLEKIQQELSKNKEIYETKLNQGFTSLQLTPLGSPLGKLTELLKQSLLKHHQDNKLFGLDFDAQGNSTKVPLELDAINPLYVWDKLQDSDDNGSLFYYPKQFTKDHQGKTKRQLLAELSLFPGWRVLLLEPNPVIPRQGKGQTIGSRPQLEAGQTPNDYLQTFSTNPTYAHEQGLTLEDWLARFLKRLHQENLVLNDYANNADSLNYLLGAYHPSSGGVPGGVWYRGYRQAYLDGSNLQLRRDDFGACPAVRIENG